MGAEGIPGARPPAAPVNPSEARETTPPAPARGDRRRTVGTPLRPPCPSPASGASTVLRRFALAPGVQVNGLVAAEHTLRRRSRNTTGRILPPCWVTVGWPSVRRASNLVITELQALAAPRTKPLEGVRRP